VSPRNLEFNEPALATRLRGDVQRFGENLDTARAEIAQQRLEHVLSSYHAEYEKMFYTREASELEQTVSEYVSAKLGETVWTDRALAYQTEVREWTNLQRP